MSRSLALSQVVLSLLGLALGACLSTPPPPKLPQSRDTMLDPIRSSADAPRVARLQQELEAEHPDEAAVVAQAPPASEPVKAPQAAPPSSGVVPVSGTKDAVGEVRVVVRARVNGKPIFNEQVLREAAFDLMRIAQLEEPAHSAERTKILNEHLKQLIDRELVLQDAYHKLAVNAKQRDKLLDMATKNANKRLNAERKKFPSEDVFLKFLELQHMNIDLYREHLRDDFVFREYLGSRVRGEIDRLGHEDILEWWEVHQNEFQYVDRVEWQDIFIALSPNRPTLAEAHRFAEALVVRARAGEDFNKLQQYDDGDSQYRKGMGLGQRRGELRPIEVETYIWNMREGEIGPLIDMSTGVHVFRLVKREYAGQMPLTPEIQAQILEKLRMEVFLREKKRVLRDLEARAVIVFEREPRP